ncbi:DUF1700 domain-containing protein [Faecalibaculum rodentium]|uniref:DUF1700 domain-containing protein n=1 Tax=Faecalibaculum rodentium TaxID=1702221 RepID=UPI00262B946D|nr:hypothetical protein [Faecalibaculum rodentium]
MTKREYLEILEKNLQGIGQEETGDILDYVAEYFDEAGEKEALEALGSPESCARQMKADLVAQVPPLPQGLRMAGQPAGSRSRDPYRQDTYQGYEEYTSRRTGGSTSGQPSYAAGIRSAAHTDRRNLWILILGILSLPLSLPLAACVLCLLLAAALVILVLLLALVVICAGGLFSACVMLWKMFALLPADPAGSLYLLGTVMAGLGLFCLGTAGLWWVFRNGFPMLVEKLSRLYRRLKEKGKGKNCA